MGADHVESHRPADAPAQPEESAPTSDQRAVAKQLFSIERRHRALMARIDRISELYQEQGQSESLKQLEELRQMQHQRYTSAQQRFREQLGPQGYAQVQSIMQRQAARRQNNQQERQGR